MDSLKTDPSNTTTRNDSCYNLLRYIGSTDEYKLVFKKAAKSFGLSKLPKLDGIMTFAIQTSCCLNQTQIRELKRNLILTIGTPLFSFEIKMKTLIGSNYIAPSEIGTYHLYKEEIKWSCKNVDDISTFCQEFF